MITTSRLGLDVPQSTDNESAYPAAANQAMGILDNAAIYEEGTLVSRPAATAVAHGTIYRATDTGDLSWSNGTAWASLCQLPASGVAQFASGTFLGRPAAGTAGRIYYATGLGQWS